MIKKIFVFLLIGICFVGFKKDTLALWLSGSSIGYVQGGYTVVATSWCPEWTSQYCNRGSSSSDCGTGFCSSGSSTCCSQANNWTKNKRICVRSTGMHGYTFTLAWGAYSNQCSLADKQIGSEPGLRAGYCACNSYSGNIYKYCCTSAGYAEQPIMSWSDDDGVYPPEKDCPGGYAIDGNRVRSSPCTPNCTPNCAATDGSHCSGATYAGNCGQTCTGNVGASCGDTNSQCSGTPYASSNGCGTCTGTNGGSCGDTNSQCWGAAYTGSCGKACTGTLGASCGDTNAYCSGTPYGSASGCGSCTGTNGGSCGDTNSRCWGVAYTGTCGKACTGTAISWDSCFNCNEKTYWTMYPDVRNAGVQPSYHYQTWGASEGRIWRNPYCDGSTLFNCGSATGKNCGDTNSHCSGTTYGSSTGCGTCSGTLTANCSATSANYCTYQTFTSTNGCGTCTGTKTSVVGTNGRCGGSNGGSFTVASPPTALCNAGTASGVSFSGTTYSWSCFGTAGICAASGTNVPCSATRNLPPTFSSIVVKNSSNTTVAAETGNVNQICQNEFNEVRTVNLTINAADPNGAGTIGDIQLRWNGINFTRTGLANGVATFNHTFAAGENTTGATDFQYYISDGVNATGWQTAGRSLKVWNCNVSTTGRLYDGGASGNCSVPEDYLTPATATNFKTLDFTDSPTMNMNRVSESEYNGNLTWGKGYTSIFNTDLAMQINGGGVRINTTICPGSIAFTLNNAIVNPYSTSPSLRVDFSGVVDQDSWYQTLGGGLMANSKITNRVPVTCTTNCAMSINGTNMINGIVASPTINNTGNSGINKGNPNNWWVTKPLVSTSKSDYTYFLNQYFWKGGIGTTLNGDKNLSDIGATGVVFINGNLTINANNSVPVGSFLMMVSNGNITVQSNVTNLEGIFVSKNFNVGGSNATALAVKGMIKATNSLQINRTFVNKRDNNINPAVNFVYRPDFVFNMPKEITKQLVKWQWGN